ncbi:MAG TPA: toast rack family protein, partial [Anaerolineaceae bacterium]|nr:toast rack family protein [Anaerolineaceae bacterium]
MNKKIFFVLIVIMLTSLACSFNINLPRVSTEQETAFELNEVTPDNRESSELEIGMGAGRLNITGGSDQWITGEIIYNVPIWGPNITRSSYGLKITQETKKQIGIPDNNDVINDWNIILGDHPTDLEINAGAYQGNFDLTGIPLTKLRISDGASQSNIRFDELNPVEMISFHYTSGASNIEIYGLSNANFENLVFEGGPGSFTLDFSGDLQRDSDVEINYGLGDMKIIIPKGIP